MHRDPGRNGTGWTRVMHPLHAGCIEFPPIFPLRHSAATVPVSNQLPHDMCVSRIPFESSTSMPSNGVTRTRCGTHPHSPSQFLHFPWLVFLTFSFTYYL